MYRKSFFVQLSLTVVPRLALALFTTGSPEQRSIQRTVSAILKHNLNLVPCYLNKSSASHLHPCLQEPSTLEKETNASGLPLSPSQGRETEAKVSKKIKSDPSQPIRVSHSFGHGDWFRREHMTQARSICSFPGNLAGVRRILSLLLGVECKTKVSVFALGKSWFKNRARGVRWEERQIPAVSGSSCACS